MLTPYEVNTNYRLLFFSQLFSTFGAFLFFVAIEIKIFTDNSAFELFLSTLSFTIPPIFLVPLVIRYTYTINKRCVILSCYYLRLITAIYLVFFHNLMEIYVAIFSLSFFSGLSFVAQKTFLQALITDSQVLAIKNGWLSSMELGMEIIGGILGSLIVFYISFESSITIMCLTLSISTVLVIRMLSVPNDSFETPFSGAYHEVLKIIYSQKELLWQITFFCLYMIFCSILFGFLIVFVFENFWDSRKTYTIFLLFSGTGIILGAWIISKFFQENMAERIRKFYFYSFLVCAASYIFFSFSRIFLLSIGLFFLFSTSGAILKHSHQAYVYQSFPSDLQEPAWGILNIIWHLMILITSLPAAIFIDSHGINWLLQTSSFLYICIVIGFLWVSMAIKKQPVLTPP